VRRLAAPVLAALLATAGLATALALGAPARTAGQAWLLALGALGLGIAAAATAAAGGPSEGSVFERALRWRAPASERPQQLDRLEREVVLGAGSAFDLHYRLRATLRGIAAQRLSDRQGLELDLAGPDVLTADTWALLRPDREAPRDRHGLGIPLPALEAIVAELEAI
jgi:hypothetical protein